MKWVILVPPHHSLRMQRHTVPKIGRAPVWRTRRIGPVLYGRSGTSSASCVMRSTDPPFRRVSSFLSIETEGCSRQPDLCSCLPGASFALDNQKDLPFLSHKTDCLCLQHASYRCRALISVTTVNLKIKASEMKAPGRICSSHLLLWIFHTTRSRWRSTLR